MAHPSAASGRGPARADGSGSPVAARGARLAGAAAALLGALLPLSPAFAGEPQRLAVAAAINVKPALDEAVRAFEAATPGVRVEVAYGASGSFFAQIADGAPYDLFLSADRDYPRAVVAAGLAAGGERVYAIGALVVWLPPGSSIDLAGRGLAALAAPGVRHVAIGNPAVAPYGRAAAAALRAAGVEEALRTRLVLGESVGQAAQFALAGAADAALLPAALALEPALAAGRVWPVPPGLYPPIEQAAVVLAGARAPGLARALLAFLGGAEGRRILARHGYALP